MLLQIFNDIQFLIVIVYILWYLTVIEVPSQRKLSKSRIYICEKGVLSGRAGIFHYI